MRFSTPPVVLNLIIINIIFFLAQTLLPDGRGEWLTETLGLHFWQSPDFHFYQLLTHMFLHGDVYHLFFNMFAMWMFGRILEYDLGGKRFLVYFLVTGIGAAALHMGVTWMEITQLRDAAAAVMNTPTPDLFSIFVQDHFAGYEGSGLDAFIGEWYAQPSNPEFIAYARAYVETLIEEQVDVVTIGASGAVFGILLAFGMLHPNERIMLLLPPIPMKAKYFVIGYGILELYLGISRDGTNIAHFAHVGGMIFGFLLLYYWKKRGKIYY